MLGGRLDFSEFIFNTAVISAVSLILSGISFAVSDVSASEGMSFTAKFVGELTSTGALTTAVAVGIIAGFITAIEIDLI